MYLLKAFTTKRESEAKHLLMEPQDFIQQLDVKLKNWKKITMDSNVFMTADILLRNCPRK